MPKVLTNDIGLGERFAVTKPKSTLHYLVQYDSENSSKRIVLNSQKTYCKLTEKETKRNMANCMIQRLFAYYMRRISILFVDIVVQMPKLPDSTVFTLKSVARITLEICQKKTPQGTDQWHRPWRTVRRKEFSIRHRSQHEWSPPSKKSKTEWQQRV